MTRIACRRGLPRLLVCLLPLLPGCTAWRVQEPPVAQVLAAPTPPERVAVVDVRGTTLHLVHPRIVGDSLEGGDERAATPGKAYPRRAVALSDIARVAVPHKSTGRTATAIGGPAIAAILGGFLIGY